MGFVGKKPTRVALSSDDITDGVIVIPLESSVSITLEPNVKLPTLPPPPPALDTQLSVPAPFVLNTFPALPSVAGKVHITFEPTVVGDLNPT